jgi:tetratricopeptide (TPR) repeat protein
MAKENMEQNIILKKTYTKKFFYAAATITGITLGGWATFSGINQDITANDLFRQNLKPYPPVGISRETIAIEAESLLFETMRLYQLENYEYAAKGFEAILEENPERPIMKFYLGVTYLHLGEYSKSRTLLSDIIDSESVLSDQATWYKALSYLAEDNIEEAISTLAKISTTNNKLGKDASELLNNLKGI